MNSPNQLPIGETVAETYKFLWNNRRDMLRLIGLPVLALSILTVAFSLITGGNPPPAEEPSATHYIGQFLLIVASTVFYVMFAVAWHRRCLQPSEQLTIWTALRWDHRKTRYLFRFVVIGLIVAMAALTVFLISSIVGGVVGGVSAFGGIEGKTLPQGLVMIVTFVTLVPALLLNARLAIWLPPAALDRPMTLPEAWQAGDAKSWRLFAILFMVSAPGVFVFLVVLSLMGSLGAALGVVGTLTFALVQSLAATFINYLTIAAGVSGLSMAYKRLRPPHDPGMPYFMNS
jgi:hypothetical protein